MNLSFLVSYVLAREPMGSYNASIKRAILFHNIARTVYAFVPAEQFCSNKHPKLDFKVLR